MPKRILQGTVESAKNDKNWNNKIWKWQIFNYVKHIKTLIMQIMKIIRMK